jgi:hypothetical protein
MNAEENLILQAIRLDIGQLIQTLLSQNKFNQTLLQRDINDEKYRELPEWVTLHQAAAVKGGCAFSTYETRWWYQPCCGINSRRVGGRKCWHRDDVIEWLLVSDDMLWEYADKFQIKIPEKYKEISA